MPAHTATAAVPQAARLSLGWARFSRQYAVLFCVGLYAVVGQCVTGSIGMHIPWGALLSWSLEAVVLTSGAPLLLIAVLVYQVLVEKRSLVDAVQLVVETLKQFTTDRRRWMEALLSLLAIKVCLLTYNSMKQGIPLLNPTLYDDELALWDRWLTLGWSPTELAVSWLGTPLICRTFDTLYVVWYLVKAPMFLLFVVHPERSVRQRFFLTYVLTWMVCGSCAMLIPSVGPCFMEPKSVATLEIPTAHMLQERLWTKYAEVVTHPEAYQESVYDGVAAFPSLHVGAVVVFSLALMRWKTAGRAMWCYSGLILIGSVLLGWHYLVDGYFAGLVAILLYRIAASAIPETTAAPPAATR